MLQLGVISVMPDMFAALQYGVTGRALTEERVQVTHWNPRDWARPPHRQVDDKPYGGGPGMVMQYEPLHAAIIEARQTLGKPCKTVYLSPQGIPVKQAYLKQLADSEEPILFVAGRYEGIDERILIEDIDEEWSLGDFVLSGGEFAAMVFIDALTRLLPGSLGHPNSAEEDSFMGGLLDHQTYPRVAKMRKRNSCSFNLGGSFNLGPCPSCSPRRRNPLQQLHLFLVAIVRYFERVGVIVLLVITRGPVRGHFVARTVRLRRHFVASKLALILPTQGNTLQFVYRRIRPPWRTDVVFRRPTTSSRSTSTSIARLRRRATFDFDIDCSPSIARLRHRLLGPLRVYGRGHETLEWGA